MNGVEEKPQRHDIKKTTEDYYKLNICHWQREGLLIPGNTFNLYRTHHEKNVGSIDVQVETDQIVLNYQYTEQSIGSKKQKYPIQLNWTPCHFGGRRAWFICPVSRCKRRVGILYGDSLFVCRHCYQLAYPCQRETSNGRATRQAIKIKKRLGWELDILGEDGEKPKGMHWQTFRRLSAKHVTVVNKPLKELLKKLEKFNERLEKRRKAKKKSKI